MIKGHEKVSKTSLITNLVEDRTCNEFQYDFSTHRSILRLRLLQIPGSRRTGWGKLLSAVYHERRCRALKSKDRTILNRTPQECENLSFCWTRELSPSFIRKTLAITLFVSSLLLPAHAVIQDISQSSQLEINVTLYPEGIALIKEKRKTSLKEGSNKLLITGVPSNILEDSFTFLMIPPSIPVKVLEYSFQTPHITRNALLQHSIGEKVQILPSQLVPIPQTGKLLAVDGEDCIIDSEGLIFIIKKNRIAFSHLPLYART